MGVVTRNALDCRRCGREAPLLMEIETDGRVERVCPGCVVALASEFARTDAQEFVVRKPPFAPVANRLDARTRLRRRFSPQIRRDLAARMVARAPAPAAPGDRRLY